MITYYIHILNDYTLNTYVYIDTLQIFIELYFYLYISTKCQHAALNDSAVLRSELADT